MEGTSGLIFYSKPGCHLCEQGFEKAERVARRMGLAVSKVDIHSHPELEEKHGQRIPVLMFRGEEVGWGRVSEKRLDRELRKRLRAPER